MIVVHDEEKEDSDSTRRETSSVTTTTVVEHASRSSSPTNENSTQLATRPPTNSNQEKTWSADDIRKLITQMNAKGGSGSDSNAVPRHRFSNWNEAPPTVGATQQTFSNWNGAASGLTGVGTATGLDATNGSKANREQSIQEKMQVCGLEMLQMVTSDIKSKGIEGMDTNYSDRLDSISTMIQSVRQTTVSKTVTQSTKTKVAQRDHDTNKEFLVVIAQGNEDVLTRNEGFWNQICSTEYSETAKRHIIEKITWPKLQNESYKFKADPGPCRRELADAIMNLAGRPSPMEKGSRGEKGFGPGFLFANDKLEITAVETEIKNQKGATLITSDDKNKCRVKLGRGPHNPEGTKSIFDCTVIFCNVLFGEENVFSGPIKAYGEEMMKISDLFLKSSRTEAEWMEKLGNPSIYALWDCFNKAFAVKLSMDDIKKGRQINLGQLVYTLQTLQRNELPSTTLLPDYFEATPRQPELRTEDTKQKRPPPANTNDDDTDSRRQKKKQRRQEKEKGEEIVHTINLPSDVKTLLDTCLEENNKGAKPVFNTEWIRNYFSVGSNEKLKEKLNINKDDCHILSLFGRCKYDHNKNHKGVGDFDHNAYKKCCQAFIDKNCK